MGTEDNQGNSTSGQPPRFKDQGGEIRSPGVRMGSKSRHVIKGRRTQSLECPRNPRRAAMIARLGPIHTALTNKKTDGSGSDTMFRNRLASKKARLSQLAPRPPQRDARLPKPSSSAYGG